MSGVKTTDINYPNDSIVIVNNLETLPGGRTLNVNGILQEVVQAGTPVIKKNGEYFPLSSAKVQEAAASNATQVKVHKGHYLRVGDSVLAGTITAIDQSNADYDLVTTSAAIGTALALNAAIVNDGNLVVGNILGSFPIEKPQCGIMVRGTVLEPALVNPVSQAVKDAQAGYVRYYSEDV